MQPRLGQGHVNRAGDNTKKIIFKPTISLNKHKLRLEESERAEHEHLPAKRGRSASAHWRSYNN